MGLTRITVADDDPLALAFLRDALEGPGREVEAVGTGAELAARLRSRERADLIVTDLSMPWMSGLQVVEAARAAGLATPFVVVTGLEPTGWEGRFERLGGVAVLRKPVGLAELRECVDALLGAAPQAPGR